jgi:hypothetical protein
VATALDSHSTLLTSLLRIAARHGGKIASYVLADRYPGVGIPADAAKVGLSQRLQMNGYAVFTF